MRDLADLPDLYGAEPIPERAMADIAALLASGDLFRYTSPDSPAARFEAEFAATIGARYALAVSSCSAALFLALKALDLPRGARVLTPAFTFAAVPSAILHADCTPVLVECRDDYRIDLADFAAKLPGAGAVVISHMRGHTSDMDAILALTAAAGIPVVEDAAHSLGTTWAGRAIGTLGTIGCFSFQSYKLLNAGEGGIMVSDDPDLIARAVIMSGAYEHNWARHPVLHEACARWQNRLPLYNLRLNTLSAALLRAQLPNSPAASPTGGAITTRSLPGLPQRAVPRCLPRVRPNSAPNSIQFNLAGFSDNQTRAFLAAAKAHGLGVQVFGLARDNARAFWNWGFLGPTPDLPQTRAMLMRACDLRLPARLGPADCDLIADALTDALAAGQAG